MHATILLYQDNGCHCEQLDSTKKRGNICPMDIEIIGEANGVVFSYARNKALEARDYFQLVREQEGSPKDTNLAEKALQNALDREDWAFMEGQWNDLCLEQKLQERVVQFDLIPKPLGQRRKRRRN